LLLEKFDSIFVDTAELALNNKECQNSQFVHIIQREI